MGFQENGNHAPGAWTQEAALALQEDRSLIKTQSLLHVFHFLFHMLTLAVFPSSSFYI